MSYGEVCEMQLRTGSFNENRRLGFDSKYLKLHYMVLNA